MDLGIAVGNTIVMTGKMENDPAPIPVGTKGIVKHINEVGDWAQISVEWENGRTLMILDTDSFAKVE